MNWSLHFDPWAWESDCKNIDTEEARGKMKAVHVLAKYAAKWIPKDDREISDARRSLFKLKPDYTLELVWIMSNYRTCALDCIQRLLRTPTIKSHTSGHRQRLEEFRSSW